MKLLSSSSEEPEGSEEPKVPNYVKFSENKFLGPTRSVILENRLDDSFQNLFQLKKQFGFKDEKKGGIEGIEGFQEQKDKLKKVLTANGGFMESLNKMIMEEKVLSNNFNMEKVRELFTAEKNRLKMVNDEIIDRILNTILLGYGSPEAIDSDLSNIENKLSSLTFNASDFSKKEIGEVLDNILVKLFGINFVKNYGQKGVKGWLTEIGLLKPKDLIPGRQTAKEGIPSVILDYVSETGAAILKTVQKAPGKVTGQFKDLISALKGRIQPQFSSEKKNKNPNDIRDQILEKIETLNLDQDLINILKNEIPAGEEKETLQLIKREIRDICLQVQSETKVTEDDMLQSISDIKDESDQLWTLLNIVSFAPEYKGKKSNKDILLAILNKVKITGTKSKKIS
jgi:hypothetical protein